jgi:chemotaxis protein methyltransferase CheR
MPNNVAKSHAVTVIPAGERPPVNPSDYDFLRKFLKDQSGLDLPVDKNYLIDSRLQPLSRQCGLPGIGDLVHLIKAGSASIAARVVEAMATHETFFFRDKVPFKQFSFSIVPELLLARARRKTLRIWCAGGSTGQEPYSLAMCLKEMGDAVADWRIEILATDFSQAAIDKSKSGLYNQVDVQRGLPVQFLIKYFRQMGDFWQLNPDIRAMVKHRQHNLLHDFSRFGVFDVIFCRNVLTYFDQDTRTDIFDRLAKATEPDGFLALGSSETAAGFTSRFEPLPERHGFFRPTGGHATPETPPAAVSYHD